MALTREQVRFIAQSYIDGDREDTIIARCEEIFPDKAAGMLRAIHADIEACHYRPRPNDPIEGNEWFALGGQVFEWPNLAIHMRAIAEYLGIKPTEE